MSENEESSDEQNENLPDKIYFICELWGDPINNTIKPLTSDTLTNCIKTNDFRKKNQSSQRSIIDFTLIEPPISLEEKGYHQQCYKQLTNLLKFSFIYYFLKYQFKNLFTGCWWYYGGRISCFIWYFKSNISKKNLHYLLHCK